MRPIIAATIGLIAVSGAHAETVTFEMIPNALSADDMSPDGRWIVGSRDINGDGIPDGTYRYDALNDEMIFFPLNVLHVRGVSDDGSVVLGTITEQVSGLEVAAIWTEDEGVFTSLGYLGVCGSASTGYELSADGTVAVGLAWDTCSGVGFRWTQETGMVALESLANGNNRSSVVSGDGQVIGGFAQGSFTRTPALWAGDGTGTLIDPPNGDLRGEVHGLSDDGTILLCESDGLAQTWTASGGLETIGTGGLIASWSSIPLDIADDGTVVGFDILLTNRRGWIYTGGGVRDLKTYATDHGAVIPTGLVIEVPQAISTDGRFIVGHGFGTGAWRMTIMPDTCDGDTDGTGAVDFQDLLIVLANWGTDGQGADIAEPTDVVDFSDLLVVLSNWGPCS